MATFNPNSYQSVLPSQGVFDFSSMGRYGQQPASADPLTYAMDPNTAYGRLQPQNSVANTSLLGGTQTPSFGGLDIGAAPASQGWMKDSGLLGSTDSLTGIKTDGWGGMALGGAQALGGLFMGMKNYGLAKDTFEQNKAQYEQGYAAQKTLTNDRLADRQHARVASNATAYGSLDNYSRIA